MNGGAHTECTSEIYHVAAENVFVCLCRALSTAPIRQLVGVVVYLQEIWTVMRWSQRRGTGLDAAALWCILPSVKSEPSSSLSILLFLSMCTCVRLLCAVWPLFFSFYLSLNFSANEGQVDDCLLESVLFFFFPPWHGSAGKDCFK